MQEGAMTYLTLGGSPIKWDMHAIEKYFQEVLNYIATKRQTGDSNK
jgi:hypothetical protein